MSFDRNAKKHQEAHTQKLSSRDKPLEYEVEGVIISVDPTVFPPASDTRVLAKHIDVRQGDDVLELTTGAGVLSIIAAKQGGHVTAIDINPDAIKNAKRNFETHNVSVETIVSDLYTNIPAKMFDYIFVNGPYFEGEVTQMLEYASLEVHSFTDRLLDELPTYLKPTGQLLITFAEFGEIDYFYESVQKHGLHYELVDYRLSSDGVRKYNLFRVTLGVQ